MSEPKVAPGPDAHRAFRLGMTAAAVVALVGVGALYGSGAVGLAGLGFALLVGFPVYLLFAASALSVWLGFTKDATDLRRVYVERERARQ